ncbi:16S rRNA (uracil(1498)-N(3))-methyltransferase [Aquisalimonas asiatica]|uniref:Ribosomal RNA small subunit methyltransferase E n=1 Tax=Aquisalimonas asiatica TaxID=406100 RepID=A0A1H8TQ24_9GAMM|nr:16S rRNA (uracil(1498)-N(3))-methyltransferase [Aquisalimonas asiatica]SEO93109.1 16S rRNA (uracil1498-N3)-methyltransferase [Aquisalimonas asiatica]
MRVPRIHVAETLEEGRELLLEGAAANHLRVLRVRSGHPLVVFDGHGVSHDAELCTMERRRATVLLGARRDEPAESPLPTVLIQGVSKGDRMDWAIQKAVELGVTQIVPVLTARSVANTDTDRLRKKDAHWHGVMVSACEQCGRSVLPRLEPVQRLMDCWETLPGGMRLVLHPDNGQRLGELTAPGSEGCSLLVGPEGGLNEQELTAARGQGFAPVRLGPRVLRTETAGVAMLAALQALWGDLA